MDNTLTINGEIYQIIDTLERVTIPDSFVFPSNKIGTGSGHREIYFGSKTDKNLQEFLEDKNFKLNSFFLKEDLIKYFNEVKDEYHNPEQEYQKKEDLSHLWEERMQILENIPTKISLNIVENTGRKIEDPRLYVIPTEDSVDNYDLIRKLSLPNITYLSVIKLKNKDSKIEYYFRLFVDYFGEESHPALIKKEEEIIEEETSIDDEEKKQLVIARQGQGKYRKALLEECPFCPITLVTDDRLLIASHIKPWVKSNDSEKLDPKNGFMFTPTYDFLFDRGFISFSNDKKIIISPWLSKMTCSRLNIAPNKQYSMLPTENREEYLDYHRNNILKK